MRIVVCGGRDYDNREAVFRALDTLHARSPVSLVIQGGTPGGDRLGGEWAAERGIAVEVVRADWSQHGAAAGPIRNQKMADMKPDGVVAFPGGRGTADMCRRAEAAGIKVWRPYG